MNKIVKRVIESTYAILYSDEENPKLHVIGTGFFISEKGLFLTAKHVVNGIKDWSKVIFRQPKGYGGRTISEVSVCPFEQDLPIDVKLLKVNNNQIKKVKITYLEPEYEEMCEGTP